jgi:hypothetical protein
VDLNPIVDSIRSKDWVVVGYWFWESGASDHSYQIVSQYAQVHHELDWKSRKIIITGHKRINILDNSPNPALIGHPHLIVRSKDLSLHKRPHTFNNRHLSFIGLRKKVPTYSLL